MEEGLFSCYNCRMEKARLPSPAEHSSYQLHRRQLWTQILLPLIAALIVILTIIILSSVAAIRGRTEVERWAAISTIWLLIPVMVAELTALILLLGLIYGMARLSALIPPHTGRAQRFIWRVEGAVKRGADRVIRPILFVEKIAAAIKRLIGIKQIQRETRSPARWQ